MNLIQLDDTRRLEVASVRYTADGIAGWAEVIRRAADKAHRGVKAARKIETAVYRYSRFICTYSEIKVPLWMTSRRLADDREMSIEHQRAGAALCESFSQVETKLTGILPWVSIRNLATFKFAAVQILNEVIGEMAAVDVQCHRLQGKLRDEK